ncbi:uncharacterized protein FFE2_16055 [Fusarium fujikuroi]|nr:uncharacterized protein FFE2_16055 [Fusarium fujikuroi]
MVDGFVLKVFAKEDCG